MENNITEELKKELPNLKLNIPLKNHTTFRIGGDAKYFVEAESISELVLAAKLAKRFSLPFYILGGGSKLLVPDVGFEGLIIKAKNSSLKIEGNKIFVEAGVILDKLIRLVAQNNLSGLEWAAGIPGTVGGAVRGNAGAWSEVIGNSVLSVLAFDLEKGKEVIFKKEDCDFSYRGSIFKKNPNLIILSCELVLVAGDREKSEEEMKKHIDYRIEKHPLKFPSAGSIFENPKDKSGEVVPAGKLIADCGLAGKRIGNVQISEKHSNFIINLGDGKAEDVKKLIVLARGKVKESFGIEMKEELQYL
jgi:UDP-N-acetylmuramate dehydrogenase